MGARGGQVVADRAVDRSLLWALVFLLAAAGCSGKSQPDEPQAKGRLGSVPDIVVDDQDLTVQVTGNWHPARPAMAYEESCVWAPYWENPPNGRLDPDHHATATVRPDLTQAGMYEVYGWWCDVQLKDKASRQMLWLCASRGYSCVPIYINPQENTGQWNSLGTYYLGVDADLTVRNGARMAGAPPGFEMIANGAVVVDAFRFVYRSPRPAVLTPVPWGPEASPTP
jgi:hypothetical protein